MAVDKKSSHVGNHGGAYSDEQGMSRQFTYIDHDVKTKISVPSGPTTSNIEWETIFSNIDFTKQSIIDYCNDYWNVKGQGIAPYTSITREILDFEYSPLLLMRKLSTINNID